MTMLGVLLLVVGGVIAFALHASVRGVDLNTLGVILMIAGGASLLIGLFREAAWRDRWRRDERPVERDPRY